MFFHNLNQIFRSLWRYKSFSLINLLGLALGITAIIVIFLITDFESKFDNLHSTDNIYRVVSKENGTSGIDYSAAVPYPTGKFLNTESTTGVFTQTHYVDEMNVKIGNQSPFIEKNVLFADSMFFNVLDFAKVKEFWLKGNPSTSLHEPRKAILTASTAKKYFADKEPIGQIIKLDNKAEVEVVAVIKDVPATTHLPFAMIVSYSTLNKEFLSGLDPNSWTFVSNGFCYAKLPANTNLPQLNSALAAMIQKNIKDERAKKEIYFLQPLKDIHFNLLFETSNPSYTVSYRYLTMLLLLGGFIILIACINYINLSTSLAFAKAKEVGIRKSIGASRKQLFFLYMQETFIITITATIAAIFLAILLLPYVNQLLDKSLSIDQLVDFKFIAGGIILLLLISFISGAYPSIVLSGFNPIVTLKGKAVLPGRSSTILRKALVAFQFTTSIALIICTIVIARQMQYFKSKPLGFNKEAVVEVSIPDSDSAKRESLRTLLAQEKGIKDLSFCLGAPISENGFNTDLKSPRFQQGSQHNVKVIPSDLKYASTYGLKLLAGRWLLPGEEKNIGSGFVVNEQLTKELGFKNPEEAIGHRITIGINEMNAPIVGVTQNFHVSSLHREIVPTLMTPFPYFYYAAGVKLHPADVRNTLASIEKSWRKIFPEQVYEFSFVDEALARSYEQENRDFALFKVFSIVSIFICCIGLWGLIAFVVVRKTKEIGIRKVLGASVKGIVFLISKEFVLLVILGLLIASPIAWYFMNNWLQDFAYRINISWWIFAVAGAVALGIAFITISFQAVKAALANPTKNLRSE
ncbi:MAG TPA: ABC transporter permease [Segetibacter sp.]|jgi:ABC-type antimicrobial peptide transport system permease subunit